MTTILHTPEHPNTVDRRSPLVRGWQKIALQLDIVTEARERLAKALYHVLDADMPVMKTPDVAQLQNELALAEANLQAAIDEHQTLMAPLPQKRVERFRNTAWLERLCHKRPVPGSFTGKPFLVRLPEVLEDTTHLWWNGATNSHAMTLVTPINEGIHGASKTLKDDNEVVPILRVLRDVLNPRCDWKPTSMAALVYWAGPAVPVSDYTVGQNVRPAMVEGLKLNRNLLAVALPPVEDHGERCYMAVNRRDRMLVLRGDGWMSTVAGWALNDTSGPEWKNPPAYENTYPL